MDGDFPNEGRVEICAYNSWGTVCGNSIGTAEAAAICNQLGYSNGQFSTGAGILVCTCAIMYTQCCLMVFGT